jgi:hypothetical protein
MDAKMNEAYDSSPLPRAPNRQVLDVLCQEAIEYHLDLRND